MRLAFTDFLELMFPGRSGVLRPLGGGGGPALPAAAASAAGRWRSVPVAEIEACSSAKLLPHSAPAVAN